MRAFSHRTLPASIVFGAGARRQLPALLAAAQRSRALVVTTPGQVGLGEDLLGLLGDRAVGVFAGARMHTPVDVTEQAVERARTLDADCLVAVGGGSTTGLAKAVSVRLGIPQFILPTTYAGSEVTPVLGETENGRKTTRRAAAILPGHVIYDPELTLSLPVAVSVTSAINALAHAAEALYARDLSPIVALMAREAIAVLAGVLPAIKAAPSALEARSDALYAAWLCGTCLGSVGMGLHHQLCHVLGGSFGLPHAPTHCVILPHALAYNRTAAPEAYAQIGAALGVADAAIGLQALVQALGGPLSLQALGMPQHGLERVVDLLLEAPYDNPAPLERSRLEVLLLNAWAGAPPHTGLQD